MKIKNRHRKALRAVNKDLTMVFRVSGYDYAFYDVYHEGVIIDRLQLNKGDKWWQKDEDLVEFARLKKRIIL